MTPEDFGTQLVRSGDLDPIYLMLNASSLPPDTTARWCLAYWMFYHAGVASRIAEQRGDAFWGTVWIAQHEKWPRGTERRHFRGDNSRHAIMALQQRYPVPEDAVAHLAGFSAWRHLVAADVVLPVAFAGVAATAQLWVGFGPWIAFKIADMLDCVIGVQVDFPQDSSVWFDDPVQGAIYALLESGQAFGPSSQEFYTKLSASEKRKTADAAIAMLMPKFRGLKGPDDRPVRIQELETILCKYKSHLNGRYPLGKDTREILHALNEWGPLAQHLRKSLIAHTPGEYHGGAIQFTG